MIEGRTSSGFDYRVNPGITYDAKFIKAASKLSNQKLTPDERAEGAFAMIDAVFSDDDDEIERFMKHLAGKSETGRADIRVLLSETDEIVAAIREADADAKK